MSNRSLIEFNHDLAPGPETREPWLEAMEQFFRSGDPTWLPQGATFIATRHHTEPRRIVPLGQEPTDAQLSEAFDFVIQALGVGPEWKPLLMSTIKERKRP